MKRRFAMHSAALAALLAGFAAGPALAVTVTQTVVDGLKVNQYAWTDSQGRPRTLSLKIEGSGNPGHGGYAVAASYQFLTSGVWKTKTIKASAGVDGGFGYFVSHERYRLFSDGSNDTIASKIFHTDDSPLGLGYPVTTTFLTTGPAKKIVRFSLNYSHYGTIAANGLDPDTGNDSPALGTSAALYKRYSLPVDIYWFFQDGADFPRIRTQMHLDALPGPDRVSFDVRGPYGKLDFDGGANPISQVRWGDSHHFALTTTPLTRSTPWTWGGVNGGARYSSLIAGGFEMGLVEPGRYIKSHINDGYSDARGKTSSAYHCSATQVLPCDWEWPYQSSQYELPGNSNGTTTSEKIAWGSTPYFGTSLTATFDGLAAHPFDGFPASKLLSYDVCLVLGRAVSGGLSRSVALAGQTYRCADSTRN